jgi:tRNA(Arg) A34 adenosine deaminase TadA
MSKKDLIHKAIQLAVENVRAGSGGPFGALVAKSGEIVCMGTNLVTSTFDPTAHAEIIAVRKACSILGRFELSDCELYCSCEPCPMCLAAIYWARVSRVYFAAAAAAAAEAGFSDLDIKQQVCLPYEEQGLSIAQISDREALAPFDAWQAKIDRIVY